MLFRLLMLPKFEAAELLEKLRKAAKPESPSDAL
jgi:hypothetical protein